MGIERNARRWIGWGCHTWGDCSMSEDSGWLSLGDEACPDAVINLDDGDRFSFDVRCSRARAVWRVRRLTERGSSTMSQRLYQK